MTQIPQHWLRHAGTPEEFERAALERKATVFRLPFEKVVQRFRERPFGRGMIERWRNFVKQLGEKDELWFFCSPEGTSAKKLGCQGYAIVRDGAICATLITLQS
jgi:hypothetical protein